MNKRLLINATNLNEGGGVQVATSFLNDLINLNLADSLEITVFVSDAVNLNLQNNFFNKSYFVDYQVKSPQEINALNSYKLNKFDIIFTIFGPFYLPLYKKLHISGFAQPWIIYKKNDVLKKIGFWRGHLYALRYALASYVFKQANVLIVESQHIKDSLVALGYKNSIHVVENAISSTFFVEKEWSKIDERFFDAKKIKIGVLSGSYIHKNLDFIVKLASKLNEVRPETFQFIFTLKTEKYKALIKDSSSQSTCNLGPIQLKQCPNFYRQVDAVMLPSLLECFSITPLESMLMKRIIFLSDRDFFKMNCFSYAKYFDPLDVNSAVDLIENWFFNTDSVERGVQVDFAYQYAKKQINSVEKSRRYIQIIRNS